MDVETLQAQIDLSNSIAYDLVSSWVKPSASSSTTSVSHTISRELEEYAKRPPRLGLGAAVSKSSLATSREAARLKGKLVGQKRRHGEGNDHDRVAEAKRCHTSPDDEDEGESRSAAISTKKVRVKRVPGFGRVKPEDVDTAVSPKKMSAEGPQTLKLPSTTRILTGAPKPTLSTPCSDASLTSAESRPSSPSRNQAHSPVPSQSAPLLNLHGPPLDQVGDEAPAHPQEESARKKRKRRRRRGKGRKSRGTEETV